MNKLPLFAFVTFSILLCPVFSKPRYHSQKLSRLLGESNGDSEYEFNVENHNAYFKRISENLNAMETAYNECLANLSNANFTEESVDACVGTDMIYVINDIDYERRQMLGRSDAKIRAYMAEFCYKVSDGVPGATSCDVLERDILTLMWEELNFGMLIGYHRSKYTIEAAQVPDAVFDKIVSYLQGLYSDLNELLDEIEDHSIITRANIKKSIDMRSRVIVEQAQENVRNPMPKIIKHTIEIEEKINNPNSLNANNIPRPTTHDGSATLFSLDGNPQVDAIRDLLDKVNDVAAEGPTVTLPERRLNLENGVQGQ